ncbi:Glyoxalase/Bleomycin resistance protein/Dioxygenase superfamily protein [Chitinophaga sp. YR627]|uniref:VOC family protein n=1 Tax=Chitinophaga sp. YR627 TaxID=1881041 RepID=UPI0008EBEC1A|nr:VOC family protein [Chitinophaga sp. YR627]SFO87697.1 Glyoxalase/Bleomycin resistance protein/Dioxygenase superfamily protein [Chitinophaga sp. YR627]
MKALSCTTVFHVSDVRLSLQYYTEILGFAEDFILGDYAGLYYDHILIHLCGPQNQGIKKMPGNTLLCIECDEVDRFHGILSARGALILNAPEDRIYGLRDFAVNDPDGNTVVFGVALSV